MTEISISSGQSRIKCNMCVRMGSLPGLIIFTTSHVPVDASENKGIFGSSIASNKLLWTAFTSSSKGSTTSKNLYTTSQCQHRMKPGRPPRSDRR